MNVATFLYSELDVKESGLKTTNNENDVNVEYFIKGVKSNESCSAIEIYSRDYIDGGNGQQIEVYVDEYRRLFPFSALIGII